MAHYYFAPNTPNARRVRILSACGQRKSKQGPAWSLLKNAGPCLKALSSKGFRLKGTKGPRKKRKMGAVKSRLDAGLYSTAYPIYRKCWSLWSLIPGNPYPARVSAGTRLVPA
ncbi:hypothetical protein A8F39_05715 [Burkholderia cenocepacia]|nr:hypothetical protein A8F39_05715 [Burkholderia cenocepacia]